MEIVIDSRSNAEVAGHLRIMADADFIDGAKYTGIAGCLRLKMAGHEFLEGSGNDRIWAKIKALAIKTSGGLTLTALKTVMADLIEAAVRGDG